jgi:hypothetical protein
MERNHPDDAVNSESIREQAGNLASSLSMKLHPQPAATRNPASRR